MAGAARPRPELNSPARLRALAQGFARRNYKDAEESRASSAETSRDSPAGLRVREGAGVKASDWFAIRRLIMSRTRPWSEAGTFTNSSPRRFGVERRTRRAW